MSSAELHPWLQEDEAGGGGDDDDGPPRAAPPPPPPPPPSRQPSMLRQSMSRAPAVAAAAPRSPWKTFEVLAHVVKEWEPTTPGAVRNMLDIVRRAEAEMATACGERSRASERLRELSLSLTVDGSPTAIRCR